MKTYFNLQRKHVVTALLLILSTYVFSQDATINPGSSKTTTNIPSPGPTDYGRDATTQKIKKRIISFGFFSPLNQHISFGYDQLLGTDAVLTTQLGIIGPGINNDPEIKPSGVFVEAGVKLFFAPDFVSVGTLRYNTMQGMYFKPQIVVSVFSVTQTGYSNYYQNQANTTTTTNYTGAALILNLGKQWILAHSVSLDIYGGIGYDINNSNNNINLDVNNGNYYSFEGVSSIVFAGGVNIGVPF
ncbi:MAG: hypothetical protein ACLQQ4_11645 [Bacteroidia bacterium]